jgi:hypothetical protein
MQETQIDWTDIYNGTDLDERFREFHKANPQVFDEVVKRAAALRARGFRRAGMQMILENIRYSTMMTTGEQFKINNSFQPYYTRLLSQRRPDLGYMFEVRTAKADNADLD